MSFRPFSLLWLVLAFRIASCVVAAEAPLEVEFLYGRDELFPSVLVSLTGKSSVAPEDPAQLGDPRGVVAVALTAPAAGATVRVTLAASPFFAESTVAVALPEAGRVYRVAPTIRFHNERLAVLRQPVANFVLKFIVEFPGARREVYRRVMLHGVHDCPIAWPVGRGAPDAAWRAQAPLLLAAYANENHPDIDQTITRRALQMSDAAVKDFYGYQRQQALPLPAVSSRLPFALASLDDEIQAIYASLRDLKFRFVNQGVAARPAAGRDAAHAVPLRPVRLLGEVVASRQANELELVLLFASVLRKLSIDAAVLFLPGDRVLLGVYRRPGRDAGDLQPIDLREIATASFAQAVESGERLCAPHRAALWPTAPAAPRAGEFPAAFVLDLEKARAAGVLPIAEPR